MLVKQRETLPRRRFGKVILVKLFHPLSRDNQIYLNVGFKNLNLLYLDITDLLNFLSCVVLLFVPLPVSDQNEILSSLFQARPKIWRPAYFIPDR